MELAIEVAGLDAEGVKLISPTHPEFDALARPMLGRVADIGLKLKPFLVIVSNESDRTMVSFSHTWRIIHADGRRTGSRYLCSFPEVICGDTLVSHAKEYGLLPGAKRLEANGFHGWGDGTDDYYDPFLPQFVTKKEHELADVIELRIELDAAIFDDGTLVGVDENNWLSELFSNHVQEKQNWYRVIMEALDAGKSVEEAFEPIRAFAIDEEKRRKAGERPYPNMRDRNVLRKRRQAAAEAASWRRRFNDEEIPALLKQSIRLDPFVIRRRATA